MFAAMNRFNILHLLVFIVVAVLLKVKHFPAGDIDLKEACARLGLGKDAYEILPDEKRHVGEDMIQRGQKGEQRKISLRPHKLRIGHVREKGRRAPSPQRKLEASPAVLWTYALFVGQRLNWPCGKATPRLDYEPHPWRSNTLPPDGAFFY